MDSDMKVCAYCGAPLVRLPSGWMQRKFCSFACSTEGQSLNWTSDEVMKRVSVSDDGCWLWLLSVSRTGYGRITHRSKVHDAYRFIYELLVGPVPDGLHLDHTCHNRDPLCPGKECKHRLCVNPDHLEPVTQSENVRRAAFSRATCPNGHPYTPENTRIDRKTGGRRCRTCHNRKARAYAQRIRERAS